MKRLIIWLTLTVSILSVTAQNDVLATARRVNDYFMRKYSDPTIPTNVMKLRPSSLWTRAVYYEGLMALYEIDRDQRYIDYTDKWASFHQWTPRNGVNTCDADDQCCAQTYLTRYQQSGGDEKMIKVRENLNHQMSTPNEKKTSTAKTKSNQPSLYGWWMWIDAIQMAMPVYIKMYMITGDIRYRDHAMAMYRWSRNECGGGLFNEKEGLWWRDADYVPPYKEPDNKDCYWSRGNGWVYAALVRCLDDLPRKEQAFKELRKDFVLMSEAIKKCQRTDGFWNPSLVSSNYAMPETSGTSLFLYGICWGIRQGILDAQSYRPIADRAWEAMVKTAVHPDGFLGWMQGTGKDPSAGQPLSYDRVPDFEDYGTGCFLLGAVEYYKIQNK